LGEWTVQLVIVEGSSAGMKDGRWKVTPKQGKCGGHPYFQGHAGDFAGRLEKVEAVTLTDWRQFSRKMPGVPQRYEVEPDRPGLIPGMRRPRRHAKFPTDPVLMAKAYMIPWAVGLLLQRPSLGCHRFGAGLDQLMLPSPFNRRMPATG